MVLHIVAKGGIQKTKTGKSSSARRTPPLSTYQIQGFQGAFRLKVKVIGISDMSRGTEDRSVGSELS